MYFDNYELKYLKNYDIKVWVEVTIGRYSTGQSKKKRVKVRLLFNKQNSNTCAWFKDEVKKLNEISLNSIVENFPKDLTQVPDIFINLYTGLTKDERIGYIRLKANDVFKWNPTPRWLHFNAIDMNKDSPGSILCNIQFIIDNENSRRIFKNKGITSMFTFYAHIVSGFELDPKNSDDCIETKIGIELVEKSEFTQTKKGRFPFWNELICFNSELDWKLDFAPDVGITLYQSNKKGFFGKIKEAEIGNFTVPVRSIQELKKYPHYFNLIKNNEKVGRILAMFYICPLNQKDKKLPDFSVFNSLKTVRRAKLELIILGGRNLDFSGNIKDFELKIELLQNGESDIKKNIIQEGVEVENINSAEGGANKLINFCKRYEFFANIYGNTDFQIFPYLKISIKKNSFFGDDERFLLFNLSEFSDFNDEANKKLYRLIFEQNIDELKIDQEQYILKEFEDKISLNNGNHDESFEIILKSSTKETPDGNNDVISVKFKEEINEEDVCFQEMAKNQVDTIFNYKNMDVSDTMNVICGHKDKLYERESRKNLRLKWKKKLRYYKAKDVLINNNLEC